MLGLLPDTAIPLYGKTARGDMINHTNEVNINRPVEEVFTYVTDITKEPAWNTDFIEGKQTSEGAIGPGTVYHIQMKPFMGISEGTLEVIEFEPNQKEVRQGDFGSMNPTVTHLFESIDGGTKFTRNVQIRLTGFMRLMEPLLQVFGKRRNASVLASLKRVLDQE